MKKIAFLAVASLLLSCGKENENPQDQYQSGFPVAIDMGLSVKWANANLGATAPEDYGDYYAWGETEPKDNYLKETYKWINDAGEISKYVAKGSDGIDDNNIVLDPEDDAAHVKLGGKWRMPTNSEISELVSTRKNDNYQWEWTSLNGHDGWLVTYLVNNHSIFFPIAGFKSGTKTLDIGEYGHYWSSTLNSTIYNSQDAWFMQLSRGSAGVYFDESRVMGLSVRPVSE